MAASTRSVASSHKTGSTPPTSDPIPIDEDEDVLMFSDEENQVISIKSVSTIFIFGLRSQRKTETSFIGQSNT